MDATSAAISVVVPVRRFRCRACKATCTVGPAGMLSRRRYTATAIALALMLWALRRLPAQRVRDRVKPGQYVGFAATRRWASLLRWARALTWGAPITAGSAREQARRTVEWLAVRGPLPLTASPTQRVLAAAQAR